MIPSDPRLEIEIILIPKGRPGGRKSGPTVADQPSIPRITRLMALAIKFQNMVKDREVRDYADLARLGYVTRARLTQIMNLLNLAPDIQEEIVFLPANSGHQNPLVERNLRPLTAIVSWDRHRTLWQELAKKPASR